jgi:hypothetical protein
VGIFITAKTRHPTSRLSFAAAVSKLGGARSPAQSRVGDPSTRELGVRRLPVLGFRCTLHKRRRAERGEILG